MCNCTSESLEDSGSGAIAPSRNDGLVRLPSRECGMIIERQQDVTVAATAVMERTSDPRLREIMVSLVKHLHGFIRDVRLTEAEFREATAILAELGRLSTDTHNEVVLMAGSLGVSSLVCLLNNGDRAIPKRRNRCLGRSGGCNSPRVENGGSIVRSDTPGAPLFVNCARGGQGRQSDRRSGSGCLARFAGRSLREPGSRTGGDEPARQVHDRCRRTFLVSFGDDDRLSDSDRRSGRPSVEAAEPASLSAGASPCADFQAGFQGP